MRQRLTIAAVMSLSLNLFVAAGSPAGDAGAGKDVFEAKCWDCHNTDTDEKKVGPSLKGTKSGKLPSGKKATREILLDLINKGSGDMPPMQKMLSDQEKEDVIAYVLTL